MVMLVDFGRQLFMSNRGLGDVSEIPRDQALCSHAITSIDDILFISDAKEDTRSVLKASLGSLKASLDSENKTNESDFRAVLSLFYVACERNVVRREYGIRPRESDGKGIKASITKGMEGTGSVFWFCIPCPGLPATSSNSKYESTKAHIIHSPSVASKFCDAVSGILGVGTGIETRVELVPDKKKQARTIWNGLRKIGKLVSSESL